MSAPLTVIGENNHFDYESQHHSSEKNSAASTVTIPDLFVSFVSQKPSINPFYEVAKSESEAWISRELGMNKKEQARQRKADLSYFAAVAYPDAAYMELRTTFDLCLWFIAFDDEIDEGHLSTDLKMATKEVERLLATMKSSDPEEEFLPGSPYIEVFRSIWFRVASRSSPNAQQRFIAYITDYCSGLLDQISSQNSSISDIDSYLALRRKVTFVYPILSLNEYVHALDMPDSVFEDKCLQEIQKLTTEVVLLQNDILSYHREQITGVNNNLPSFYRTKGLSQQTAYDMIGGLIKDRYRKWYILQSDLPQWGEYVDIQVQKYLKGCQDAILANMNWSFRTERYFGKETDVVRKNRVVATVPW